MTGSEVTNILIVDDLPEKLLVYRTILEDLGQNLIEARSGEDALRQVLQHEFSVILLDVNMPTMDGFETARVLRHRKRSAHTPIIFVTSFADEMRTMEGYSHGAVDFILAPVVPEILRAKIRVFVELFRMNQQVKLQADERIALAAERSKRLAAEEANRNLTFLSRCGSVLGQSLDLVATTQDVARLAVHHLADAAYVAVAQGDGCGWTLTCARKVVDEQVVLEAGLSPDQLPPDLANAIGRVFIRGVPERLMGTEPAAERSQCSLVLPLDARGRTIAVLALVRDVARGWFQRTEEDVAQSLASRGGVALDNAQLFMDLKESDRQRNEFLSMLAHELRNPLAPIRNAVEILRSDGLPPLDMARSRDVIGRQVNHLIRLVDDLLDVSRITQGKIRLQLQPIAVASAVAHAVEASRPEMDSRRHRFHIELPAQSPYVLGDATRLAQIITNLLNNAAKYTNDGGQIWLSVRGEQDSAIITIRDTGIGIPPEMLGRVFDLFTQVDRTLDRSQGGLGIGLTLVRRLVEMHHGKVEVHSEGVGQGSEFKIALPACSPPPQAETASKRLDFNENHSTLCRVLIVDDNRDSADSLAVLLKLSGFATCLAYNGPSALAQAERDPPDVVLLDIGLPGIDGYEVARRLRAHEATNSAFLVAITGYGKDDNRKLAEEAGFDRHFIKPVVINDLLHVLKTQVTDRRNLAPVG